MTRIVIVDDHAIVRKGLRQILADAPEMAVTAECADGQELLRQLEKEQFDLVLLDISMPGRNGIDLLKQVKGMRPDLPVLILSMHPEEQYAIRALKSGASGYITKESAPDELVKAIRKVSSGGVYVSSALAERLALALGSEGARLPHESLSDREYQILCLIASGRTVKEIAEHLSLSVKTISTYRTRMLAKMRMKSNAELSTYAIRNGLVD
jgi:two-component system, NarL family, invasion response regulator UvrY